MKPRVFSLSALVTAGLVGSLVFGASTRASAADVCIDKEAIKGLSQCPNVGPKEMKTGSQPQVNFRGVAPMADPKKGGDDRNKPKDPNSDLGKAGRVGDRQSVLKSRQKALLVTEIQGLESLFRTTPKNAADRPQLARRLAEDYVELEAAAFREKTEAEIARDGLKKSNPAGAGQKQTAANQADTIMKNARKKAVEFYTLVTTDYPNYPALDEVLYYLAYEYEQALDNANARKVYFQLIDKRPNSKYVPNAYLAFGELFFNEAQGDPSKWDLAGQAYQKVIGYPAQDGNKVYGYAWYKLAYVNWNQGNYEGAMNGFKKVIDYGTQFSQVPNAIKLAESARRDIIPVYALKGNPSAAFQFLHPLSGDQGSANDKTYKMMDDLGQNYLDTGHYPEAIVLYKDLMNRDRGSVKTCSYQVHITEATMAMKSGDKAFIKDQLENQLKTYSDVKASGIPDDAKHECASKTAALVTETGMAWHLEAVGTPGQRGTSDTKTMDLADKLYKRVVDTWSAKDYATFEFPRLDKRDWPTIYKIKYAMADLLYVQEKWAQCGPAFDAVVAENPESTDAAEAAYASVLCYQKVYETQHPKDSARKGSGNVPGNEKQVKVDELKQKEFTDEQKGMVQAFNRYICYIKPADQKGKDQLNEVKFARARTYFEARHWEEAATAFREIAISETSYDGAVSAAQLYLESLNVVGSNSTPPRPSCYDDMAADVPKFLESYCTGDKATKNADDCNILNRVQADILAKKWSEQLKLAGTQQGTQALESYEKAGSGLFDLFRKYCQEPVANGQKPESEKCDKFAYSAGSAFQAARLIAKSIAARQALINFSATMRAKEPKSPYANSWLAQQSIGKIGGNFQAIAVYEKAAEFFEKYAAEDLIRPSKQEEDDAAKAGQKLELIDQASKLSDAVILRLGLGQEEEAIKDAATFRKRFGATKAAQTAAIQFAIGAHYADKEDWGKARDSISGGMTVIEKAPPDVQVQAHATLGRAYAKLKGQERQAHAEYAKVRSLWANPDDAIAKIKASYPGEDDGAIGKRVAKALTAVGEAYFDAAEQERIAKVESVKFPVYSGPGTKEAVLTHINTKVKAWLDKKREVITKVEAEYRKIVDMKPDAPPRWVIAAGSRVGLMWGNFVDEFRGAPIPTAWKSDPELRGAYYDGLDGASQPIKDGKAKPALATCLTYSVKFQYFDEFSRSCEVWLGKNYKGEYHVVDELRGSPTLSNSGLDEKEPPLLIGGQSYRPMAVGGPDKISETPAAPAAKDDGKKK